MTGQRIKSRVLLLVAACAIVIMIAWSQTWSTLSLDSGVAGGAPVAVSGQTMAPGLSALGLTSLALLAALSLAGPVFRRVLGAIQLALGMIIAITTAGVLADSISAAAPALVTLTGVQDVPALRQLVVGESLSAWPFVAVGAGILTAVSGLLIVVTAGRWPLSGRKYAATQNTSSPSHSPLNSSLAQTDVDSSHARIDAWDDLSRGGDPTS
jgi:uncharacterized membrane protein (TIGR02234 family)